MIGIGIDRDVTNAAIKAIQDVMDRNSSFDSYDKQIENVNSGKKLSILLGVPIQLSSSHTQIIPSPVNVQLLFQKLFPNCYEKQELPSIHVQVGGLNIKETNSPTTNWCSLASPAATTNEKLVVVACLSYVAATTTTQGMPSLNQPVAKNVLESSVPVQQRNPFQVEVSSEEMETNKDASTRSSMVFVKENHQISPILHHRSEPDANIPLKRNAVVHGFRAAAISHHLPREIEESSSSDNRALSTNSGRSLSNELGYNVRRDQPEKRNSLSSIDLLAHISASIIEEANDSREKSINGRENTSYNRKVEQHHDTGVTNDLAMIVKPTRKSLNKPLPITIRTPKNHTRHFVQHSYQDYSDEIPPVIYDKRSHLNDATQVSATSLAFPLKLHEALNAIERDKKDNIFGWLPHGRSFKIHHQQEFAATILPNYFVMTKKSSFLRQLNLYGFRRISDGSYYHERFLRGMSFLCQSMQRQKVNGNGVRAAGNPDDEPNLSEYPPCPASQPTPTDIKSHTSSFNTTPYVITVELPHVLEQTSHFSHSETVQIRESESSSPDIDDRAATSNNFFSSDDGNDCDDEKDYNETVTIASSTSSSSSVTPQHSVYTDNNNNSSNMPQRQVTFPSKLQRILDQLERDGSTDIISWLPHGRAFIVHDIERFVKNILPLHFSHSKYSSFQRQCHMYHFVRINHGPDKGAYYHPKLLRGRPDLSVTIRRSRNTSSEIGGQRRPGHPNNEPNLYLLPPMPAIQS